ncbi:hypothetical protein B0H13DRAFT_2108888 [Mycena leptocephala]|nr:hypothetical protein B0H13DRAFT_2108888 [Mycena leptocephala]
MLCFHQPIRFQYLCLLDFIFSPQTSAAKSKFESKLDAQIIFSPRSNGKQSLGSVFESLVVATQIIYAQVKMFMTKRPSPS